MVVLFNRRKYMRRRGSPQGAPADLADATITVVDSVQYTGNPVYPSVTVTYEGATLVVNQDYTLNYSDNTNVGAATVVVTGMGEFTGQVVKTFQIVSSGGGGGGGSWADFDLANLGDAEASASLRDSTATYGAGEDISLYGIQVLPGDSIFFAAAAQGHPYIWGFDDGHVFEVEHFKSTYTSRGRATASYRGGILGDSGSLLYDTDQYGLYKTVLDAANVLATENTRTFIGNASLLSIIPYRMQFSHDGSRFFGKDVDGTALHQADLSTPWNVSSTGGHTYFNLAGLSGLPAVIVRVYAFQFSPDGKALVFTCENNATMQADRKQYIIKLSLSTAYDLSTASVHSYKQLSSGGNWWQGVAVNNAGTKMLLFKWNNTFRAFYEYNLA